MLQPGMLHLQRDFDDQAFNLLTKYEKRLKNKWVLKHPPGVYLCFEETWWFGEQISSLGEDCWVLRFCCSVAN